jgi:hypothetical protein
MPYDRTHDCWMFPTSLFGNKRSTGGKWKRIVSHVLESGNWTESLEKQPRRNVLDDASDMMIKEGVRAYVGSCELWRMYCPHDEIRRQADRLDQFLSLKFSGLSELWFMVGLLEASAVYNRDMRYEEEYLEQWWIPLFRGIIHWLPELEALSQRIAWSMDVEFAKSHYEQWYGTGCKTMAWIDSICCMATVLGTKCNPDDIGRKYQGDLVAALLDLGIIKRNGDRFASLI